MNIKVKYNHPASPIKGIALNKIYVLKKDTDTYLEDGIKKIYLSMDKIKVLFEPIDGSKWDDILKTKLETKEVAKPVIENTEDKFKKNRKFKEVGE